MNDNKITKPSKVLNLAYRKVNVTRNNIDNFKNSVNKCLEHIEISEQKNESEENIKKYIGDFLNKVFYTDYLINTKDKIDLAIYAGKDATSKVNVLIETKRPSNTNEFLRENNINKKALQELLLYYLRERIGKTDQPETENNQIKHLIATNGYEWYFFKGEDFYNTFYKNKNLIKEYNEFVNNQKDSSKNELFYNEIAKKYIEEVKNELPFLYINLKDYQSILSNKNKEDKENDVKLISLYKVFSPIHLLAQPYGNDSNLLNKDFYFELLHIIGLEEVKEEGKILIKRKVKGTRNKGSLLETTIFILEDREYLPKVKGLSSYGKNAEEQVFNVALELCLTWINRILFLKLLEAQLVAYNENSNYKFLNIDFLERFNDLEDLFFSALAKKIEDRNEERIKEKFKYIPYLNSSLFEPNELEHSTLRISSINGIELELYDKTVLKNNLKQLTGKISLLSYIFRFLDAYDFSGEDTEKVEESNQEKTLISASVLGLIFEKINGYQDGSFYTPAYITMYMAREVLQKTVVQKFNEYYGWSCTSFEMVKEEFKDYVRQASQNGGQNENREIIRKQANQIINSIKICDPAVGSGHFLVSILNELIVIKSEFNILLDKEGKRLNLYIKIINDELIVENENDEVFAYKPKNKYSQLIQETLFHEKQNLIESCLFGVDINPNSVKICRLRLWIELLKNAYYTEEKQLQTLPNIDINIKTGNSLISRFDLDEDYKNAFKSKDNPYSLEDYKNAVYEYKNIKDRKRKTEIIKIIDTIKSAFTGTLDNKFKKKIAAARGKLEQKQTEVKNLEAFGEKVSKTIKTEFKKLKLALNQSQNEKEALLNNVLYQRAFEWRFEFPEVLDENGTFVGFDIVIGNPPYGIKFNKDQKEHLKNVFQDIHMRTPESYNYFVKLFTTLASKKAYCSLIIPSSFLNQAEFEKTRKLILTKFSPFLVVNIGDGVFGRVTAPTCIIGFDTNNQHKEITYGDLTALDRKELDSTIQTSNELVKVEDINKNQSYSFIYKKYVPLITKCYENTLTLKEVTEEVATGVSSGLDKAYVYSSEQIEEKNIEKELLKKLVVGGEINRFYINPVSTKKLIYITNENNIEDYPNTEKALLFYKNKLVKRREAANGKIQWYSLNWPRRKKLFDEPKILIRQTANKIMAAFDEGKWYCLKSGIIIQLPKASKLSYQSLLGLLNSSLLDFLYRDLVNEDNRIFPEVKPIQLFKLPIKIPTQKQENQLTEVVNKILKLKEENPNSDTNNLENQIDILVYKLYELTYEEVLIIDEDFELSEQEYREN